MNLMDYGIMDKYKMEVEKHMKNFQVYILYNMRVNSKIFYLMMKMVNYMTKIWYFRENSKKATTSKKLKKMKI